MSWTQISFINSAAIIKPMSAADTVLFKFIFAVPFFHDCRLHNCPSITRECNSIKIPDKKMRKHRTSNDTQNAKHIYIFITSPYFRCPFEIFFILRWTISAFDCNVVWIFVWKMRKNVRIKRKINYTVWYMTVSVSWPWMVYYSGAWAMTIQLNQRPDCKMNDL